MKTTDKNELIQNYINNAISQGEATLKGDYKTGNKECKKLSKIYKIMEKNLDFAKEMLDVLLNDENINVRIWASAHALGLNVKVDKAEDILKEISSIPDIGLLGFNAEMTLKVWKERGYLKF